MSEWPEEQIALLTKLWCVDKLSRNKIAAIMGLTPNAVIGKVHRLQLERRKAPQPRWTPERLKLLRSLCAEGKSRDEIAAAFRVSADTIQRRAKLLGLRVKSNNTSALPRVFKRLSNDYAPLNISFADIQSGQCRYTTDGAFYCGQPAEGRQSYCSDCWALTHQPVPPSKHSPFRLFR